MIGTPERALEDAVRRLRDLRVPHALIGGMAVSVRSEVRFTRDLDLAVAVADDEATEALVRGFLGFGYRTIATVEHEKRARLATVRLESSEGFVLDLMAASCGIEAEIVARSTPVHFEGVGPVPVARAEDLLVMKVLSMTTRRLQDRIDAERLLATNADLDLDAVRTALRLIAARGFDRGQDLERKLERLLAEVSPDPA